MKRTKHNVQHLKSEFRKNGLPYSLIKRNDIVALFGVGGTFTEKILHYEICRIKTTPAGEMFGKTYPAHETIPGNEQFGRDGSAAIVQRIEADKYFDTLTKLINAKNTA